MEKLKRNLLEQEDGKFGYHIKASKSHNNCKREISRQSKRDISRKQDHNNYRRTSRLGVGYWK